MIKNSKKTEAQKRLITFRNQLHHLLIKYPEIRITGDINGDVRAWSFSENEQNFQEIYLPHSGKSGKNTKE